MKKGILDALVLSILDSGEAYGYELSERVAGIVEVSETALYPVLRRLEAQSLLSTRSEEHKGRLRKYYRITADGRRRLGELLGELEELERVIAAIAKGRKGNA